MLAADWSTLLDKGPFSLLFLDSGKPSAASPDKVHALLEEAKVPVVATVARGLDGQLQKLREGLSQEETKLQQLIAEQREAERQLETGRVGRESASDLPISMVMSRAKSSTRSVRSS